MHAFGQHAVHVGQHTCPSMAASHSALYLKKTSRARADTHTYTTKRASVRCNIIKDAACKLNSPNKRQSIRKRNTPVAYTEANTPSRALYVCNGIEGAGRQNMRKHTAPIHAHQHMTNAHRIIPTNAHIHLRTDICAPTHTRSHIHTDTCTQTPPYRMRILAWSVITSSEGA